MINKLKQFFEDVNTEMKKVSWPEKEALINSTIVVIVVSALFTLFIFAVDTSVSKIINLFY